ncbi:MULTISPECIES: cytochrome P450 family protein [Catenuloplanes]|uniref:Cytochrome P450 n=1 Tax=Catenuloplanes niger TaxID=587534 RepID=A0AAE4CYH8_9ACTN|nr:cytochrome P450 [Catenuloplanes niger]MDR7327598.1 cytochrome P450 [Catenuloplanes niger]
MNDSDILTNPHPVYAAWRAEGPVRRVQLPSGEEVWMVTGYHVARAALTDGRLSKAPRDQDSYSDAGNAINRHMLSADPPDHTRLRRLVAAAFTTRRVEELRPRIEGIADALLDEMRGSDRVDLISAYAFPLPVQVICLLLGIPPAERDTFRAWSGTIAAGIDPTGEITGEDLRTTVEEFIAYLRGLIAHRHAHPGDDLLSALVSARDDEDRLSADELTSMAFLLLAAGHETTMNLIGNGVYLLLLRDRRQWERLRADRALLPAAIEEFLRYESPVELSTGRVATEDFTLGGQRIRAGDIVMVNLLAANRDPAHFESPDELIVERPRNPHVAFGHGIHHCLGAPLARVEGLVAFDKLLTGVPGLTLAVDPGELSWRPTTLMRSLRSLPVRTT